MLDAVLRRGQTMDNAAQASRGLPPADAALASAIAGETLRRLPDLDALIDGATRQNLPEDSKARMVLRLALAQKAGLGTPDHHWSPPRCRWSMAGRGDWSMVLRPCCARAYNMGARACRRCPSSAGALPGEMTSWRRPGASRIAPTRPQLCERAAQCLSEGISLHRGIAAGSSGSVTE
jgi:hypothetical protein